MSGRRSRSAEGLFRAARTLRPPRAAGKSKWGRAKALPTLVFFTDPDRTPDPESALERLPRGAGVVYRAFGAPDAEARGRRLVRIARRRGLTLLAGADARLAARIGADGVHLPERAARAAAAMKRTRPGWIVTCAAHSAAAVASARRAGADAVFVSPVFASASPSAARPLGPLRFAQLARAARLPVYALGGIDARTARRLAGLRLAGLAAVDALRT